MVVFAATAGGIDQIEAKKLETEQHLYAASISLADQALKSHQIVHAQQLARWIPSTGQVDRRDFAWRILWRQLYEQEHTLRGHTADVYCVRYSHDGRYLATASQDE